LQDKYKGEKEKIFLVFSNP